MMVLKKQMIISLVICLCMFALPVTNYASVPQLMSYQGLLKDAQGNYLTGTYNMAFRIYSAATGGTALWTETQSGVSATSGRFNVELGSVSALNLPFNTQYWLSIQVGSDPEMSPRVKLTSAGYAYNSENVVNGFTESAHDNKSHMDVEGVKSNTTNIAKTNFKLDAYSSASANNMGDMVVDVFKDESGIDTTNSTHYVWQGSPNYSVTTQIATGGIDSYTKLMLHSNGTDGATTVTDSSSGGRTVTANGNAQIDTAQSKFGGASTLFDGSGDYLSVPDSDDWDFGTGDFTIDFWIRFNNITYQPCFVDIGGTLNGITITKFQNNLDVYAKTSQVAAQHYSWSPSANTWYHVAYVRHSGVMMAFFNGVKSSTTYSDSLNFSGLTSGVGVGGDISNTIGRTFDGHIEELRISKGIARWTSNFTPPTAEYAVPGDPDPATVISTSFSETTAPSEAMIIGDGVLNGGTITYSVSRDNGTTWTQATNGSVVSLGSQPSGTQIRWKAGITGSAELKGIAVALS